MKLKYVFVFLICMFTSGAIFAAQAPVEMLDLTTKQMLSELRSHDRDTSTLYDIINRILLPHVDLDRMSQMVLGPYWGKATPDQQQQFQSAFTHLVVRTYSTALASYTNEKVQYFPIRGGVRGNQVQVKSEIDQSNGQSVSVVYQLQRKGGGEWKVYDFSVEGVSLVQSYKSQFANILSQQGMEGLLKQMNAKARKAG